MKIRHACDNFHNFNNFIHDIWSAELQWILQTKKKNLKCILIATTRLHRLGEVLSGVHFFELFPNRVSPLKHGLGCVHTFSFSTFWP